MELKKLFRERGGAFFSVDALIALVIIIFVILAARPLSNYLPSESSLHTDILHSLSELQVGEMQNSYVQTLINNSEITDLNHTILEQLGEFYVFDYPDVTRARNLAAAVLSELNTTENFGIWFQTENGGVETLIYSNNHTPIETAHDVQVAREVISGIQAGNESKGYSARAFLSSDWVTNYYYFGGYVGDGNVSLNISLNGDIAPEGEIEVAVSNNFDVYINDGYYDSFVKNTTTPYDPDRYTFNTTLFHNGTNIMELRGTNLYVAGGFVKMSYKGEASLLGQNKTYSFPGINGLINLYDGFFIPSNLSYMEISLHLNSNYSTFLNIGNVTVYRGSTTGAQTISINNSYLASLLNYSFLNEKTVPLRLGLDNASYIGIDQRISVFSVTDLSGSMGDNCGASGYCNQLTCSPIANCQDYSNPVNASRGCKTCDAKSADILLINFMLGTEGNAVGLVAYSDAIQQYHDLTNNSAELAANVTNWNSGGTTCICCGINKALEGLVNNSRRADKPGRLLVYYDFDQGNASRNISDRSGLHNNGTLVGAARNISGIKNQSFNFTATGTNYILVPDLLNSTNGSISFWANISKNTAQTFFDASSGGRDFYIDSDNSGNLRFRIEDTANNNYVSSYSISSLTKRFHHIVAVWNYNGTSPATQLYLDGKLVASNAGTAGNVPNFASPQIGENTGGSSNDLEGAIDEFRIYTKALTVAQIVGLNTTAAVCGNSITEVGEVCDGDSQYCTSGGYEGLRACNSGCNGFLVCNTSAGYCGDGFLDAGEECDDGDTEDLNVCTNSCLKRYLSMVVMSDGVANTRCSQQGTGSATQDAIQASDEACTNYGVVVHSVGFGDPADIDQVTMTSIANNGCGGDYYYSDASNLSNVYQQIATTILTDFQEQSLSTQGGSIHTRLYPDSYIRFNYDDIRIPYGLVITAESDFDNGYGGHFYVPAGVTPVLTRIVSYSGARWTTGATLNGQSIFNLSDYGSSYLSLGDPYQITDADSIVVAGTNNFANVTIGSSVTNQTKNSSAHNKIIYTLAENASSYSDILPRANGSIWNIQLEDGSNLTNVRIPSTYTGNDRSSFNDSTYNAMVGSNDYGIIANTQDAYQVATLDLMRHIDLNDNGKIDVPLTAQDLQITLSEISGIPFDFSTEVQIRRWI